jgi:Protein of unknown function (DUF1308)
MKIINTMAGPGEKERALELMSRITIVEDELPPRVANLVLSAKVKSRSQTVFGTGDAIKAMTVSANEGFVRGASNQVGQEYLILRYLKDINSNHLFQSVDFVVFLHESRALTEMKEQLVAEENLSKLQD